MITPKQIVLHLAEYLPRVTNLFSDSVDVSTVVASGGNKLTVNTNTAHGLTVGSAIIFTDGKTPNTISSVINGTTFPIYFPAEFELPENLISIEFENVHDFTTPNLNIGTEPLPCNGFNESEWNTTLRIVDVPTDKKVVVNYPSGATEPPTFTAGNAIGYEERPLSIFGIQAVSAVSSTTQFEVLLNESETPAIPDGTLIDVVATTSVRVAAVDNVDRADDIYAKVAETDDLWAFVIMNDTDISKDRHTLNDGIATYAIGDEMRLRALQNFSVVVYFRSADKISGATAQELAYGDIYTSLLQVLYAFTGFTKEGDGSNFATVTNGHGQGTSNVAYYTEVYDWQTPVDITFANGFQFYKDVSFRRINSSFGMFTTDNEEQLTLAFDLPT